jgi:hypothetical protein
METQQVPKDRASYKRDIYQDLERIEQRGKRLKESKKEKKTAFLKFLGWKNAGSRMANSA